MVHSICSYNQAAPMHMIPNYGHIPMKYYNLQTLKPLYMVRGALGGIKVGVLGSGKHNIPRCITCVFLVYAHEIHVYTSEIHVLRTMEWSSYVVISLFTKQLKTSLSHLNSHTSFTP